MIFNFRIDRSQREFLKKELLNTKTIYQGWGKISLADDKFVAETKNFYHLQSTRIPRNLNKIQSFHDGDILLVPHFPSEGCATILIVDGNYPANYQWTPGNVHHLCHGVKIRESFGLEGNISMYHHSLVGWYGKLSGLRLPILPIVSMNDTIKEMIAILEMNPETVYGRSTIDDYLSDQTNTLLESLRDQLRRLNPSRSALSFEKVCEDLISQYGYSIEERNVYDRSGGDADLIFKKKNDAASPFETGESFLFVQVKKHSGETDEHAVDQLIQIMESKKNILRPMWDKGTGSLSHFDQ